MSHAHTGPSQSQVHTHNSEHGHFNSLMAYKLASHETSNRKYSEKASYFEKPNFDFLG